MTDDDNPPEVTPRTLVEGTLTNIKNRRSAVRSILQTQRKAPKPTEQYLRGYYDALDLVTAEILDLKGRELMGSTPGDDDD